MRRLKTLIYREVDIEDSLFVERCRDLIPTMQLIGHLSVPFPNTSSSTGVQSPDLTSLVLSGDVHAIADNARELGLNPEAFPLDDAELSELLLTPRPNSSLAVQRSLAPAQTLLIALLLIDIDFEKTVAIVVHLLGLELDLHTRRAAGKQLSSVAYDVFCFQWNHDPYLMLAACIHAMASLLFESSSTNPFWPTMTEGVFQWGDGERRFRQSQLKVLNLLVADESGMTEKQLQEHGCKSIAATVSRIRKALGDARCPWTVDLVEGAYHLIRYWGNPRRFPATSFRTPSSNQPLSHSGPRTVLSRTGVS